MLKCEFCEKEYKNISSLNFHKKSAKFCLEKQGKENPEFKCHYCQKIYSRKESLENHTEVCKAKPLDDEITRLKKQIIIKNNEEKLKIKELEDIVKEKDKTIEKLESKILTISLKNNGEKLKIKELENIIKEKEKINEKLESKIFIILEKAFDKKLSISNTEKDFTLFCKYFDEFTI